jgi:hypothetical protein
LPTNTTTPRSVPIHATVEVIGEEEIVYDWSTNQCSPRALPDLPVNAFRTADGMVQLNLSHTTDYRMIGPDLDSLQVDCSPTLVSGYKKDPAEFNYNEWMGATYTLDGETIYALIHNEFYAAETSQWYARTDYNGEQGYNNWHFQYWNGSSYTEMRFDATNNRWQGNRSLCQIGNTWAHPDIGCEPARTWISPISATINIGGSTGLFHPDGSNGVEVTILKNDAELWSVSVGANDTEEYFFSIDTDVQPGDAIHFRVNAQGNNGYDSTYLNPKINIGQDPCPSQEKNLCAQYAITFAVSTDGGQTYTQPPAPNHLVATLPFRYTPDWGSIGIWQPSNIVHNPNDGYFYVLVQSEYATANVNTRQQGTCALRTDNLPDPTSWRAWDGEGFNMTMVDPYAEDVSNPTAHRCEPVSWENLGYSALNYYLGYNSYFENFILMGHAVNVRLPGFYFSLSDDLVHWSPMQLLMEADLAQTVDWNPPFLAYPSLIDPLDTSMNFEITSQMPYLYFTRINSMSPNLDFDLVRVQIKFGK